MMTIEDIRPLHVRVKVKGIIDYYVCNYSGNEWPCHTSIVLEALDEAHQQASHWFDEHGRAIAALNKWRIVLDSTNASLYDCMERERKLREGLEHITKLDYRGHPSTEQGIAKNVLYMNKPKVREDDDGA